MATAPKQHGAKRKRNYRATDQRRGTAHERGYDKKTWHNGVRPMVLARDNHLCQPCLRKGVMTTTNLVDHIVPIAVRPDLRLAMHNLQACCPRCNTLKSYEDAKKYGTA